MLFFKLFDKLIRYNRYRLFRKMCTLNGTYYIFNRFSRILLSDGSRKSDIILGNNVCIYGKLESQNGGKIILGNNTRVGANSVIRSVNSIVIGDYTAISDYVVISDNNNHPIDPIFRRKMKLDSQDGDMRKWRHSANAPITIGENVWIGEFSRIQKGVTIGDNSIVAANAVVTKSIPANCIVGGNPAKILKYINV